MRSVNHQRQNTEHKRRRSPERGYGRRNVESVALSSDNAYSAFGLENLMNYDRARMPWDSFMEYTSALKDKILEHLNDFKFYEQEELRILCEITDGSQTERNQRIITDRMYQVTQRCFKKPQLSAIDRKLNENLRQSSCRKENQSSGRMNHGLSSNLGYAGSKRPNVSDRNLSKTDKSRMGSNTESHSCSAEEWDFESPLCNKIASNMSDKSNGSVTNRNSKCHGSNDHRKYDCWDVEEEIDKSSADNDTESLSYDKKRSCFDKKTKEDKNVKSDAIHKKSHGYITLISSDNAINVDVVSRKNEEPSSWGNCGGSNNSVVSKVIKNVYNAEESASSVISEQTRNNTSAPFVPPAAAPTSDEENVYSSFGLKCLLTYDITLMPYNSFLKYAFALKKRVLEKMNDFWSFDQERLKVLCAITDGSQSEKNQKVITTGMLVIVQRAFDTPAFARK